MRQELTAAYGVTFEVPTTVAPSISTLSPASAAPGGAGFSLTVTGTNFKNGAVVKFGGADKPTMFLSATSLSATIAASDIATAGNRAVLVTNPDAQVSSTTAFTVQTAGTLPAVTITSAATQPSASKTQIGVNVGKAQTTGTNLQIEKQITGGAWESVFNSSVIACNASVNEPHQQGVTLSSALPLGTNLRARVVKGNATSAYSATFAINQTITQQQGDIGGDFCGVGGL